jgi:hypothetical protein
MSLTVAEPVRQGAGRTLGCADRPRAYVRTRARRSATAPLGLSSDAVNYARVRAARRRLRALLLRAVSERLPSPRGRARSGRGPRRLVARDRRLRRSCIREKQQRRADGSYPCSWALPTSVVTRPARCSFRPAARMDARQQAGASMAVGAAGAPLRMSEQARAVSEPEGGPMSELLLDAAGRRRSPATLPTFHAGQSPRNKGMRYPADPPTTEEIVRLAARRRHGPRSPAARPDRRAVARRAAHPRGARARRGRP